jgi:hypothetical protein
MNPKNQKQKSHTFTNIPSPHILKNPTASSSHHRLPFDGDSLWGWLTAYLKALAKKHEAKSGGC